MVYKYYVNDTAQQNGDHEVHKSGCTWLQYARYTTDLGYHSNCQSAVYAARAKHRQSNGCKYCSEACHTS